MKSRLLMTAVAVLVAANVWAADATGKWTAQVPGRDGQTRETTFNFKVEGEKLTGTMSGREADLPIADGKVAGDVISFTVTLSFGGNETKLLHTGTVAGDEIKFKRTREGSDQAREFTATRVK